MTSSIMFLTKRYNNNNNNNNNNNHNHNHNHNHNQNNSNNNNNNNNNHNHNQNNSNNNNNNNHNHNQNNSSNNNNNNNHNHNHNQNNSNNNNNNNNNTTTTTTRTTATTTTKHHHTLLPNEHLVGGKLWCDKAKNAATSRHCSLEPQWQFASPINASESKDLKIHSKLHVLDDARKFELTNLNISWHCLTKAQRTYGILWRLILGLYILIMLWLFWSYMLYSMFYYCIDHTLCQL